MSHPPGTDTPSLSRGRRFSLPGDLQTEPRAKDQSRYELIEYEFRTLVHDNRSSEGDAERSVSAKLQRCTAFRIIIISKMEKLHVGVYM